MNVSRKGKKKGDDYNHVFMRLVRNTFNRIRHSDAICALKETNTLICPSQSEVFFWGRIGKRQINKNMFVKSRVGNGKSQQFE